MLRIVVLALAVVVLMVAIEDGRVLDETGLVGSCSVVPTPLGDNGFWEACRAGKLEGRPDLSRRSCTRQGIVRGIELWRCPAPVASGPKAP